MDYMRKHGYFIIYLEMHKINYSLWLKPILCLPVSPVSTHTLVWFICKLIFKEWTHRSQNKRIIIFPTLILQLLTLVLSVVLRPHGLSPCTLSCYCCFSSHIQAVMFATIYGCIVSDNTRRQSHSHLLVYLALIIILPPHFRNIPSAVDKMVVL